MAVTDTRASSPLANDSPPSPRLLDDYPSATQQRLENSFFDHFDLHSSSQRSMPGGTSGISQRHMIDMMENKCLHMQESLSNRIQVVFPYFNVTTCIAIVFTIFIVDVGRQASKVTPGYGSFRTLKVVTLER